MFLDCRLDVRPSSGGIGIRGGASSSIIEGREGGEGYAMVSFEKTEERGTGRKEQGAGNRVWGAASREHGESSRCSLTIYSAGLE